ncbi:MAG: tripartite tricarboxylate transporter substrate binding protein [Alphaproteobacteria bacterium]|nr:tripartite tricarboxylate transporter substrate binding protein [Alphaproteobacteria bacterium]
MKRYLQGIAVGATALIAFTVLPGAAQALDLPCRTAKLIVPWGAGGGTDVIFRTFVEAVNKHGAKPELQVVNIPGQGGNKGAKEARGAKADGCTLFAMHQSALSSYLNGRVDFTYNAFEPVVLLTRTPAIFGANPDVPYNNVEELIAYAKENPGKINVGATLGSTSHFVYLLLADAAKVEFNYVSYDGTRQRMTALLAKNIDMGEINLAAATKYITSKELKALGITTKDRNDQIGDVPTVQEQGIELIYGTDRGIVVPKGTPVDVIDHYAAIFKKAAEDPEVVAAMTGKGTSINYLGPTDYTIYLDETFAKWKRIAMDVGMFKGR